MPRVHQPRNTRDVEYGIAGHREPFQRYGAFFATRFGPKNNMDKITNGLSFTPNMEHQGIPQMPRSELEHNSHWQGRMFENSARSEHFRRSMQTQAAESQQSTTRQYNQVFLMIL
jgi:hypothetical protein